MLGKHNYTQQKRSVRKFKPKLGRTNQTNKKRNVFFFPKTENQEKATM